MVKIDEIGRVCSLVRSDDRLPLARLKWLHHLVLAAICKRYTWCRIPNALQRGVTGTAVNLLDVRTRA